MNQINKNLGKLYIIGKSSVFQTKYKNNFFVWGPRGPDRALWKFEPNGKAPTIFLKFRLYSLHGHWKNLAERTPPANEPKGPWGTLEIHESWFLPHGWIISPRIWANYTSLERAQFSKQNIQITFFVWGPRGPDRALWKFGPNGEAPTIFLKFRLYSLHGHWKNLAERTPPANEPKGPWGTLEIHESWFLPHGWIKSTRIWANYTSLERTQFSKQNIQITFFVWGPRGPDRAIWKIGPNGEAPTIFLKFRQYSLHGHWKNLAERTPPANEPKGPWGTLEIHESLFLPHGWIISTRIWAN